MKKLYALLTALAVVMSASALDLSKGLKKDFKNVKISQGLKTGKFAKKTNKTLSEDGMISIEDLVGTWDWTTVDLGYILDGGDEEDALKTFSVDVEIADPDEGIIAFNNFLEEGITLYGFFMQTEEACGIVIPSQSIGEMEGYDIVFSYFAMPDDSEEYSEDDDYVDDDMGVGGDSGFGFDKTTPVIFVYEPDFEMFMSENYYGLSAEIDGESYGDIELFGAGMLEKVASATPDVEDDDADYEDFGEAEFMDGWLYPLYDPESITPHRVALQKSKVEEGVFRLVDPFSATGEHLYAIDNNRSEEPGYIKFSIKGCGAELSGVPYIYPRVYSGFMELNFGKHYFYDMTGYYVEELGEPANWHYLTSQHRQSYISTYDAETQTINIAAPVYGYATNGVSKKVANLDPNEYNESASPAYIKILTDLDSVIKINADKNGDVEYYNLQGVKVANPAGGIFIMRNGGECKKVVR